MKSTVIIAGAIALFAGMVSANTEPAYVVSHNVAIVLATNNVI